MAILSHFIRLSLVIYFISLCRAEDGKLYVQTMDPIATHALDPTTRGLLVLQKRIIFLEDMLKRSLKKELEHEVDEAWRHTFPEGSCTYPKIIKYANGTIGKEPAHPFNGQYAILMKYLWPYYTTVCDGGICRAVHCPDEPSDRQFKRSRISQLFPENLENVLYIEKLLNTL
jgi:hypothetical protein